MKKLKKFDENDNKRSRTIKTKKSMIKCNKNYKWGTIFVITIQVLHYFICKAYEAGIFWEFCIV